MVARSRGGPGGERGTTARDASSGRRCARCSGGLLILSGVLLLLFVSGFWFGEALAWPVSLAAIGFAILWARSGEDRGGRSPLEAVISGRRSIPRVAIGTLLILGAMAIFLGYNARLEVAGPMLLAGVVAIGGAALIGGPWAWNVGRELIEERSQRVQDRGARRDGGASPRLGAADPGPDPALAGSSARW